MNDYERQSAELLGVRRATGFSHARHALMAILQAAGLERGDAIALSPLTCRVVPLSLIALGLRPVWIDTAEGSLNLDPRLLSTTGGERVKAVLFQYTYGTSRGSRRAREYAQDNGMWWIEDRAQSMPLAAESPAVTGERSAAIFSNNLLKPLPAGSGGLAVTQSEALADRVDERRDRLPTSGALEEARLRVRQALHRTLVRPRSYWRLYDLNRRFSGSYRERAIELEIAEEIERVARRPSRGRQREGLRWLRRVGPIARHRKECCRDYARALAETKAVKSVDATGEQALLYFPVVTSSKYEIVAAARHRRVEMNVWPTRTPIYPLDRLEALVPYGYQPGSCPRAEGLARRLIGLPTHESIDANERRRIVDLVVETACA